MDIYTGNTEWLRASKEPWVVYNTLVDLDDQADSSDHADPRYREMLTRLVSKQDAMHRWTAESINNPYSEFDFGQKKRTVTLAHVSGYARYCSKS